MKRRLVYLCVLFLFVLGCPGNEDVDEPDVGDVDANDVDSENTDPGPGPHVPFELGPYLDGGPEASGQARVFEVSDPSELIAGPSALGRVGDYVLENDRVRFVVEQDDRAMGTCPWGGNVIDAEYRSGSFGGDVFFGLCLFLNADQTFKPEVFEVLHDGRDGSAAVLAVTGRTEILDFFNVETMIAEMSESLANMFVVKPDGLLPVKITKYYILRPGDTGVRVFTVFQNDGAEQLDLVVSHILVGGGDGAYFNPLGRLGGFGFEQSGLADPDPDRLPFLAFLAEAAGVAYMPRPDEDLDADLPISGSYLTMHGVVASVLGRTDIIGTLLANRQQLSQMPGILHLAPEETDFVEHWIYVGDGALSTMADVIYEEMGVATGAVSGSVADAGGAVAGARVTAIDDRGRTMNQTITDASGAYAMRLPVGAYTLSARRGAQHTISPRAVTVSEGGQESVGELTLALAGEISVQVRTPDGTPTPARVSVICVEECPNKPTSNEEDITFDGLPAEFAAVQWVGVSGDLSFHVPAGTYRVMVSRGLEWSLWPQDARDTLGELIEVSAGGTVNVSAEIAQVVDTSGALSGDFHVHAIRSHDTTTPEEDRVLTFLSEGIDVLVSSDHDVISDFGPAVRALGAENHIVSLIGTEITTFNVGHINGFPVEVDEAHRRGGALDWGDGANLALPPSEIFDWIREFPGEQVVQVNHPDSSFMRYSDVLRGISYGDPARMRVQAPPTDPNTGDTGLWSDDFTAMELINGHDMGRFWGVARWWMTMIGRGERPAGTAVTDTHTRYRDIMGGVPRTFVFVDEDKDSAQGFDTAHFVEAVNAQRVTGTTGPFVRVTARNDAGDVAGLGEVLATNGQTVTFEVVVEVPEWIAVNRLQMYMNSEAVVTDPGEYNTDPIPATRTIDFELGEEDLEVVANGTYEHRRYRKVLEVEVDTAEDAYVIFLVRGPGDMYPVVPYTSVRPFAFTNPVYLDADGGGYDNPHLRALSQSPSPELNMLRKAPELTPAEDLSREEILKLLDGAGQCH